VFTRLAKKATVTQVEDHQERRPKMGSVETLKQPGADKQTIRDVSL